MFRQVTEKERKIMTTDEELEVTAESFQLYEAAGTLREVVKDLEAGAKLSMKHGAELDYIATKIAEIAKECDAYRKDLEKGE
jgi:hypothetical protein